MVSFVVINLGVLTLPILPMKEGYLQEVQTNKAQDSNINFTNDAINISAVNSAFENTDSSYPLDSPNDSLLDSNADQSLQIKNFKTPASINITRLLASFSNALLIPYITIWLIGAIIFLIYHLFSYVAFHQRINNNAVITDNSTYLASMQEQKLSLHITKITVLAFYLVLLFFAFLPLLIMPIIYYSLI